MSIEASEINYKIKILIKIYILKLEKLKIEKGLPLSTVLIHTGINGMKIQINVKDYKVVHQPLVYLSVIHVAKCYCESIGNVWQWTNDNSNFPTAMHYSKESTRWKLQNLEILEATK